MTKSAHRPVKAHRRARCSRFARTEDGATAVEFALVGIPFFVMLMAIVEITISYFVTIQLENGLETVARRVRTGQVQTANLTAAQFKQILCDNVAPLIPCNADLYVDVREFQSFSTVDQISPIDENGQINMAFQFDPGVAGSIVLARAFYVWHFNTPLIGEMMSNMAGQDRLVAAVQVFRNEPWS